MIHGFVGRRRVGKTTLSDFLCRTCAYQIRFSPRVTLPEREKGVNYVTAPTVVQLSEHFRKGETVTIIPENDVDETFIATALAVRRWYSMQERSGPHTRQIGFIVDEARFKAVKESVDLDWLFRCTDPTVAHIYLTVHRPKDLHPDIRAILDYWYVFHVTQQIDIDVLEDETTPIIATQCQSLRPREFFLYDVGEGNFQTWKETRRECGTGNHHRCSHVWKPTGSAPTNRMLNPIVIDDESVDDFELL